MTSDVRTQLHDVPIYDVHEHHMPENLGARDVGLLELLRHSYSDWCRERPYALLGGEITEAIDVLPDESRMMIGGDAWRVEATYAAFGLARRPIGAVLQEKVDTGDLRPDQATRLGRKILCENAREFFADELESQ